MAELRARCAYPRPRGADPERTPICIWVSSTGFRQPGLLCAFRRRLVTVHVSPVSPSLTKEGNAACARQVCRKVTTRETRDQRRISTWYQNLRVLSAQHVVPKFTGTKCSPNGRRRARAPLAPARPSGRACERDRYRRTRPVSELRWLRSQALRVRGSETRCGSASDVRSARMQITPVRFPHR